MYLAGIKANTIKAMMWPWAAREAKVLPFLGECLRWLKLKNCKMMILRKITKNNIVFCLYYITAFVDLDKTYVSVGSMTVAPSK